MDYVGSYDQTETTSPTSTRVHFNVNNPCHDWLGTAPGSGCTPLGTPPVPASTWPVPKADLAGQKNACGASGLPTTPTQVDGEFKMFAPAAANIELTGASYVSENVPGGGPSGGHTCSTTMSVSFRDSHPPTNQGWHAVLAFGGRIASALDWGPGNAAGSISGSSYHMRIVRMDGVGQGSQDLSLSTTALAPFPSPIRTQVSHSGITTGGTLTDTATLTGVPASGAAGGPPTGTVQFQLCSDTTTGCPQSRGENIGSPVELTPGTTPNTSTATSVPFGSNLPVGNYCVGLLFTNDDNNSFYSSTYAGEGEGECFSVTSEPVPDLEAGYADGYRFSQDHPTPWEFSPSEIFKGCEYFSPGRCPTGPGGEIFDAGAVRLVNNT
ncbi:MAG: hypothetical protein J2P28_11410, partial [Actinobacteria bacterium]|nr:hypothetical protein [Actinomycetota bacterium]